MRKLLNTLYITQEDYYLSRERDNIVIKQDGKIVNRFPYRIIENIICFSYLGTSPSLVQLCNENNISLSFLTPTGKFCGRFVGMTNGNVLLRREQYRIADDDIRSIEYAKRSLLAKISSSRKYVLRFKRDHSGKIDESLFNNVDKELLKSIELIKQVKDKDSLRGIEGNAANTYFRVFNDFVLVNKDVFQFNGRTKRPPLD
ncbi:MAG: CRISPR-associated endonuclease Cas1, partial [Tetragenococcus koreensis]|nr:CRISPR-associated endonuclease Cas1 [Tetragenococcus koreensis]